MEKEKYRWISKGDSVVVIENIEQIMTVEDFKYKSGFVYDEVKKEKVAKKFLIGVQCRFYNESTKETTHEIFHSKSLIPLSVARKGRNSCISFYLKENEYKEYLMSK